VALLCSPGVSFRWWAELPKNGGRSLSFRPLVFRFSNQNKKKAFDFQVHNHSFLLMRKKKNLLEKGHRREELLKV